MADTTRISNAAATAEADAIAGLLDDGYLRIYDSTGGTGQPATTDTAIGTQVLLAELRFSNPSDAGAANGVVTFSALTSDASANNTGTATWFRAFGSDGTSAVWDGSVSTAGATLNLNTTSIVTGAAVSVTSLTYAITKG